VRFHVETGYSPPVRGLGLAVICAVVGAAAALGIGRATGVVGGGSTTQTILVREPPAPANTPASVRRVTAPAVPAVFSPARIFASRSPGVVEVFAYFGGEGSQGSGFVVSSNGTILTNAHVITDAGETSGSVKRASSVYVEFADHDRIRARVVGWDVYDDVGVIRVDPHAHPLVPLPLGRSASVIVGQPVAAIGSPLGNANSLAVGIVSGVGRSIAALTAPHFQLIDAIQTDAPIAHGSSGGPLLDSRGRVIGINAQIRSDAGGPAGIGFAVPVDAARRSLGDLLRHGRVSYAYLGVQTEDLTPSRGRQLGLRASHGAIVDRVSAGGPAARAGLRAGSKTVQVAGEAVTSGGDVILAIDGLSVESADDLVRIVTNRLRPGETAVLSVLRDGRRRPVAVRLAERPANPRLP
jgi:2-alkenal reductase